MEPDELAAAVRASRASSNEQDLADSGVGSVPVTELQSYERPRGIHYTWNIDYATLDRASSIHFKMIEHD